MSTVQVPRDILENTSELWVRKQLRLFRLYDKERKGVIGQKELEDDIGKVATEVLTEKQLEGLASIGEELYNKCKLKLLYVFR